MILGSGTSFGVPVIGCRCRVCTSADPRDRRTRTAALVEGAAGGRILIDTPPELRLQLLAAGVSDLDAVLYTHEHADHIHGVDDLRAVSGPRGVVTVHGSAATLAQLAARFSYIFDDAVIPHPGTSKPRLCARPLAPDCEVTVAGIPVLPLECDHGGLPVYAYRLGPVAYVTDVKAVPPPVVERLRGIRVLVINALFERPHPTHLSIPEAVDVARAVGAEQTYLTHLTHAYSHADLAARLPAGVAPAYDGLTVAF